MEARAKVNDRPKPTLLSLSAAGYSDYAEAWEAGCKLKLAEVQE